LKLRLFGIPRQSTEGTWTGCDAWLGRRIAGDVTYTDAFHAFTA
jgi:hypothetical protein